MNTQTSYTYWNFFNDRHGWSIYFLAAQFCCLTAISMAAGSADDKNFDAHATAFSYFFKDSEMDFHFGNLILGAAVNHGAEIGKAFYAAAHIKNGDAASWQKEWYALGERVEKAQDECDPVAVKAPARLIVGEGEYRSKEIRLTIAPQITASWKIAA